MKGQVVNSKIAVLFSVLMVAAFSITSATHAAHFPDESTTRSVAENAPIDTNVGEPVQAVNFDDSHWYVLDGADSAFFTLNENTGQLKTKKRFDYETRNSYSVRILLRWFWSDANDNFFLGTVDSITVTINVTDVSVQFNDGASTTRSVAENTASNTNIGSPVSAANFDSSLDRYALSGTDANSFEIDSTTGQLKTQAALDFEVKSTYSVAVDVYLGGQTTVEGSISVTINVTDVFRQFNDGASTTRSVAENMPANTNVGEPVSAANFNSSLDRYALSGTNANFKIDSATGQLTTKKKFDYEVKNSYSVTVKVYLGNQTTVEDSISVTINITDGPDTSCPDGYLLYNNDCSAIAYGVGFGEADALPAISSEEAARIAQSLAMDKVIFNELHNGTTDSHDWIELRNISGVDMNLDNWQVILATNEATLGTTFPVGTVLPADGLLLIMNTHPSVPGMLLASPEGASYNYLIDEGFILPQDAFTLLLRSEVSWEDAGGNYFFDYRTPPTAPPLTADVAWYRARSDVLGTRSAAWVSSGYQGGIGYDVGLPESVALGTPGYSQSSLLGDVNGNGIVNILDLVLVASHLGASDVSDADINSDGIINVQDLVLVANMFGGVLSAPAADGGVGVAQLQHWLSLAESLPIQTSASLLDFSYNRGILMLEQMVRELIPETTALLRNYPNPFNPETWIPYHLAKATEVAITIYDVSGSIVRSLDLGHQSKGYYTSQSRAAYWDGRDNLGETVASGTYFYTLTAGDYSATRKMLILK